MKHNQLLKLEIFGFRKWKQTNGINVVLIRQIYKIEKLKLKEKRKHDAHTQQIEMYWIDNCNKIH